jgi:restriction system protein
VALRDLGDRGTIAEIDETVIDNQKFSEAQQSALQGDGPETMIHDRLAWAKTYLKGMGLASNPDRGVWALTSAGKEVTENEIEPLRNKYLRETRDARKSKEKAPKVADDPDAEDDWQEQLLEQLLKLDPAAFERLCRLLLRRAGFIRTEVTGKSSDGGIDGVGVYRMSLVSFPVFFQAKRWRNSVGAGVVRDFRGAMSGRGEKGLLITTSTFTSEARAESSRDGAPPVDLVNGPELCELLKEHKIGVTVTERKVEDITIDVEALEAI